MTSRVEEYRDAIALSRALSHSDREGCVEVLARYEFERMVGLALSMARITAVFAGLIADQHGRVEPESVLDMFLEALGEE